MRNELREVHLLVQHDSFAVISNPEAFYMKLAAGSVDDEAAQVREAGLDDSGDLFLLQCELTQRIAVLVDKYMGPLTVNESGGIHLVGDNPQRLQPVKSNRDPQLLLDLTDTVPNGLIRQQMSGSGDVEQTGVVSFCRLRSCR